jgi:hypothetical protein
MDQSPFDGHLSEGDLLTSVAQPFDNTGNGTTAATIPNLVTVS